MQNIADLAEKYRTLIEDCLLQPDPWQHVQALPESPEKALLMLLRQPHSEKFAEQLMNKFKFSPLLIRELSQWKIHEKIMSAKEPTQIKYIIDDFMKKNHQVFSYSRPIDHLAESPQIQNEQARPTKLAEIPSLLQYAQSRLKQNEDNFVNLTDRAIAALDEQTIKQLSLKNRIIFLQKSIMMTKFADNFIVELFEATYQQADKDKDSKFPLNAIICNLNKNQLNKLGELLPEVKLTDSYLRYWFTLNHTEDLEQFQTKHLSLSQKDEKRRLLIKIIAEVQSMKIAKLRHLEGTLMKQVLLLDLDREDIDKNMFWQFLNKYENSLKNQIERQKRTQSRQISQSLRIGVPTSPALSLSDDELINQYVQRLFKLPDHENTKSELHKYFSQDKFSKMYAITRLEQGDPTTIAEPYLSNQQLKAIKETKEITILQTHKKQLKPSDPLQLKLRVKNIKAINCKVYEIDLEKHYRQNKGKIDELIDVSYLQPSNSSVSIIQNENAYKKEVFDFRVDAVPLRSGVWVVELQGEGITSRAFVQKGCISALCRENTAGVEVKFYSEEGKHMTNLEVWMEDRKYQVDDSLVIPYGSSRKQIQIIALKDKYAQKISIVVPEERYRLDVGYIYNSQSFIVGSKAKVILHARLFLQSCAQVRPSLKLLEKAKVSVTTLNNKDIKSTLNFDNIEFKAGSDYVLEFPIQSYCKRIDILVSANITKYDGKVQELASRHTISIQLGQQSTNTTDLYLRVGEEGYLLEAIGMNGEKVPGLQVIIGYTPEGWDQQQLVTLVTDREGCMNLGNLQNVPALTASAMYKDQSICQIWQLTNYRLQISDIYSPIYLEGKPIDFPILEKQSYSLWRIHSKTGLPISDCSQLISIEKLVLTIKGALPGRYELRETSQSRVLKFTVVVGEQWEDGRIYDKKQRRIYQSPNKNEQLLTLGEPTFAPEGQYTLVQIPVHSGGERVRCHALASNYISPKISSLFSPATFRQPADVRSSLLNFKETNYYNNKSLSDESSYVLNRDSKMIGNNLEKPRMFLKPIEVRQTNEEEQMLNQQGDYEVRKPAEMMPMSSMARCMKGEKQLLMAEMGDKKKKKRKMGAGITSSPLSSHNNFLKHQTCVIGNQTGDVLQFKIPNYYSRVELYLLSKSNAIKKLINIPNKGHSSFKNLTHTGLQEQDEQKAWSISRQIYHLFPGKSLKVGRDSSWAVVGIQAVLQFSAIQGVTLDDWVKNWETLTEAEKLKIYNKQVCHQLNTYIKFKDPGFYEKVVRPFIINKIQKTFVDYYLLDDQKVQEWDSIDQFGSLNSFQQVLLVEALVRFGDKEKAIKIADYLSNVQKSNKISYTAFKNKFDVILEAKITAENRPPKSQFIYATSTSILKRMPMAQRQQEEKCKRRSISQSKKVKKSARKQSSSESERSDWSQDSDSDDQIQMRAQFKQAFKQQQKTKQYTETTYANMKNPLDSKKLIPFSPFWAAAARYFAHGQPFQCQSFMYLLSKQEFTLALCLLPLVRRPEFDLQSQRDQLVINSNSEFLVFARELKPQPYSKKYGVMMSQRFYDPENQYYYEEDGTQVEKEIREFVRKKPYCVQTLITNTSGTSLELQTLVDIPQGSIPLLSHEYTLIENFTLAPFATKQIDRLFYFPESGRYNFYPANSFRIDQVIAKAQQSARILNVKDFQSVQVINSLDDALKSGDHSKVLDYLAAKNIFDQKLFNPQSIVWMLKDKSFFEKALPIFRKRKYYNPLFWLFGYFHMNIEAITEYQSANYWAKPSVQIQLAMFEYFPYNSSRVHGFLDGNKSKIRNTQLRNNYHQFIFASLFQQPKSTKSRLAFAYYLLLQDRVDEAQKLCQSLTPSQRDRHSLQFDYIDSFIDMCNGGPSFTKARAISKKNLSCPIQSWRKIFAQIDDRLRDYDEDISLSQEFLPQGDVTVNNDGHKLRISIQANTEVRVNLYHLNLELYYSSFPFGNVGSLSASIVPNKTIRFDVADKTRQEQVLEEERLNDCLVEVVEGRHKIVSSFMWSNSHLRAQVKEEQGVLQVFKKGHKVAGCYCKVYQMKDGLSKFYRDGYTDNGGVFKYALANISGVSKFSILVMSEQGGIIIEANPPSLHGRFS